MSYLVILKLFKGISYSVGRSGRPTKATSCSGDQKWTNHGMHPWLPPMPEKDVAPSSTVFPQTVCNPSLVVSETSLWSSFTTPVFVISVERIQTRSIEHRVEDNIYYIEKIGHPQGMGENYDQRDHCEEKDHHGVRADNCVEGLFLFRWLRQAYLD